MGQRDDEIQGLIEAANELQRKTAIIVSTERFDLEGFQREVAQWAAFNFPKEQMHHLVYGLMEEIGELTHHLLKRETGIRGTQEEHTKGVKDAIGDMMVFLVQVCNRQGLTLAECIEMAWSEVKNRDWVQFPHNGRTE